MSPIVLVLGSFCTILALQLAGIPIGFVFFIVGFAGAFYFMGAQTALSSLAISAYSTATDVNLACIPLFILMGFLASEFGYAADLYQVAARWVGRLPGGLAVGSVIGCGAFGTLTGSSTAGTATIGVIAYPEMRKYGYQPRLALGTLAAAGTLGSLIPPSLGLIITGILTELSIGKLFMAGILPGALTIVVMGLTIVVVVKFWPHLAPPTPSASWRERFSGLPKLIAPVLVAAVALGGIYSGFFTATESAAMGCFIVFMAALIMKRVTTKRIVKAFSETMRISGLIFLIVIGVLFFTRFIALSGFTKEFAQWVGALPLNRYTILTLILLMYIPLGMFIDAVGMKVLTLPFVFPIIILLGFDGLWFGIILQVFCELGNITPPLALNVFTAKGIAPEVSLSEIYKGVTPFCIAEVVVAAVLILFPMIALYLPGRM